MNTLNANDLKVGGVTAIETALQDEQEVAISVRGERRFVVMALAQYEHLRECELEAAWLATQADRTAGRARGMTAVQHMADMETRLKRSAPSLSVHQVRAEYKFGKAVSQTPKTKRPAAAKPATVSKSPRGKTGQAKTSQAKTRQSKIR